jgi:hypothetical protein
MKFVWYDGSIEIVKDNRIRESFKHFMLIPNKADRENNLDDLDDVLEEMDEHFEDKNMEYTKEHSDYLQTKSKEILASLKDESFTSLLKDRHIQGKIQGKTIEGLDLETFPSDYTLNDIDDEEATNEIIGKPEEGVLETEHDYPLEDIYNRIGDKNITYSTEKTTRTSKLEMHLELPAETPEDELGKLKYWEKKDVTPRLHKPEGRKINPSPKTFVIPTGDFKDKMLEYNIMFITQIDPDTNEEIDYIESDFDRDITKLVWEDAENREKYFGKFIPQQMLDPYTLYDLDMKITFHLEREITEEDLYQVDERAHLPEGSDITNENYGEFILDEEGKKIPKFDEDEIDGLMHVTIKSTLVPKQIIKLEIGKGKTTGMTERTRAVAGIHSEKGIKVKVGRAGEFEGKKLNMARHFYIGFVRARLRELEEAINAIPTGA